MKHGIGVSMGCCTSALVALLLLVLMPPGMQACARGHEDCSHSGCCVDKSLTCYKKDNSYAGCRPDCTPGIHDLDPPEFRTPWSCDELGGKPGCAATHENCEHLGCCKDPGYTCYRKNAHWASCRKRCKKGIHRHDPPQHRTPWSCEVIREHHGGGGGQRPGGGGDNSGGGGWIHGLTSTHFWDCNGAACDAAHLQPFNLREYKYAPHYAPQDPSKHGGAKYGERLWMTGAASDALTDMLGPDTEICGSDNAGGGGCGQCILVKNPHSNHPDWTVVVMKKNRCPPHSNGCDKPHMDFAVPGFDHLQYSTANICGSHERSDTYITKQQSGICGSTAPAHCNCHALPGNTKEQRALRDGCLLFKEWGWLSGTPSMSYKRVECPDNFVQWVRIGNSFNHRGVMSLAATLNSSLVPSGSLAAEAPAALPAWPSVRTGVLWAPAGFALVGGLLLAGRFGARLWPSVRGRRARSALAGQEMPSVTLAD